MAVVALALRKLESWIDTFVDSTVETGSPPIYRRWAAISAVAGALERKVWVTTRGTPLYPNLYILLVGPPGVGKSIILAKNHQLWAFLKEHYKASSSLTRASFIDTLNEASRKIIGGDKLEYMQFNSLTAAISEFGVLLPAYDHGFMSTLTDIYDGSPYSERRRTKDLNIEITDPNFNLIAGTTPSYLGKFMPEGAWDQGFISRNIMVYYGIAELRNPFEKPAENTMKELGEDLKLIGELSGEMHFSEDANRVMVDWVMSGTPPVPDHPRLVSYNARRISHVLKLCMVASASRSNSRTIELVDYQHAIDWLLEAEAFMPDIFHSMAKGGDSQAIDECLHFMWSMWQRSHEPIPEFKIHFFLSERVPAYSIEKIINTIVRAGLAEMSVLPTGVRGFKPLVRHGKPQ